ncbi:MAG: UDP-N-acetylmuramate--L-alanine ligase [Cryomorphaceae bacterium]|nr:UDP-N-acetylmuramate--L-alanine ligase [Cryomorphaceae bacterium]MBT6224023.1 UDP-N-acetylmuramate--L-alanine ligase [Cryomorphaceae bacterium]MBT6729275.1 UDP-N-acetylmuramate--L-alanine ligase [Cryomorphaceae bacterium]
MINKKYFFIGIGGIGMSSIAQYLHDKGNIIFGYDRENNQSVKILLNKGIVITNKLNLDLIPKEMIGEDVEIIYTPAVKDDNIYLDYFISKGLNKIYKRSEILGEITKNSKCIAVAGTHGKTTTTGIISHLLYSHGVKFKAFVGGIMKGYNSNYIYTGDDYVVVEADEYDRSFLNLSPDYAVITSIESDHLDVYGDFDSLNKSFELFASNVASGLVAEEQIKIKRDYTFSITNEADYRASNILMKNNGISFNLKTPNNYFTNVYVKIIGMHNLKNVLSALSVIDQIKEIDIKELLPFLGSLKGIERRMEVYTIDDKIIIDDYAHHPTEIESVYDTIITNYKNKSKAVIFQPHLFSRTRDFMDEFALVLSKFDEVYLLDIYPAREKPIDGVNSQLLLKKINSSKKEMISKDSINDIIINSNTDVISILGAGNLTDNLNKEIFTNE